MASVKLGRWILYYVCESPHRDGNTRMCVCVCVFYAVEFSCFLRVCWENLDLRIR